MKYPKRSLLDLVSVGPATLKDFKVLGIHEIKDLARKKPEVLYAKLCRLTGVVHDPCCIDVFAAAIAQAKNPTLPKEKCQWWYWSKKRKLRDAKEL